MNVVIVDYDPQWPRDFESLRARIWPAVSDVAAAIEHVGSTSVPGLAAGNPVLDIDIVVESQGKAVDSSNRTPGHHRLHPSRKSRNRRPRSLTRPINEPNDPAHNLYVCRQHSAALRDHLTFRDYLRTHPGDCESLRRSQALPSSPIPRRHR